MAQTWTAKAPTEVVERRWAVPLDLGDAISAVSTSATGVTVDSDDYENDEAVIVLSAGSAGAIGEVTVTVATDDGRTHVETFYIPIQATTAQSVTARTVCAFALRKIAGMGMDADAAELNEAVELLQGVMARHGLGPVPLDASSELDIPDDLVMPLKLVLRKLVHSTYEAPLTPTEAEMADWGERYLTNAVFAQRDLSMPVSLSVTTDTVADLF